MVGLELTWWGRETSDRARVDTVEVADKRSGLKRHGGGRRQAIALKLMQQWRETSNRAQIDTVLVGSWAQRDVVEAGDEQSGSN